MHIAFDILYVPMRKVHVYLLVEENDSLWYSYMNIIIYKSFVHTLALLITYNGFLRFYVGNALHRFR